MRFTPGLQTLCRGNWSFKSSRALAHLDYPGKLSTSTFTQKTRIFSTSVSGESSTQPFQDIKDQRELIPFRPLPPKTRRNDLMKPAPLLTNEEIKLYFPAFYSRLWGITFCKVKRRNEQRIPRLTTTFLYERYSNLVDAVERIAQIAEDENHHPEVTFDYRTLTVHTYTHSAFRRDPTSYLSTEDSEPSLSRLKPVQTPGLTLRDVRLGMLVELALASDLKSEEARRLELHANQFKLWQPPSLKELEILIGVKN